MPLFFHQVLDTAEHLTVEEQETLIGILQNRKSEKRRAEIVQEIHQTRKEHADGKCQPVSPEDLVSVVFDSNY